MWERRSYNDGTSCRCTVKFRGELPQWKGLTALGVEWDDPARGRHSGELNGTQYFDCRVPNSGSFVKASRPFEHPKSFEEAVGSKYLTNEAFEEQKLSKVKSVETVGIDKLYQRQSQLDKLESLSVEGCLVNRFDSNTSFIFSNLIRLDLSNNLLGDFDSLVLSLSKFPKLRCLRLNGNRFNFQSLTGRPCIHSDKDRCVFYTLEDLELAFSMINEEEIARVVECFPNLTQLGLAHNQLGSIPPKLPVGLGSLDLANNPISSLRNIPESVETIFLSKTKIPSIPDDAFIPQTIDLRDTSTFDWDDISQLGAKGVVNLHLDHATNNESILKKRPFIVARCPDLLKLDGTIVTSDERTDAELYTLTAVASKRHPDLPSTLWNNLISKYGAPAAAPNRSIRARLLSFYIDDRSDPLRIPRNAPIYRLHWLVAHSKGHTTKTMHIKTITDVSHSENDALANLSEVGDLLVDGQHLETYTC